MICGAMFLSMVPGNAAAFAEETEYADDVFLYEDLGDDDDATLREELKSIADGLKEELDPFEQAIKDFIIKQNADSFEKGDVTICFSIDADIRHGEEDSGKVQTTTLFGDFWEYNYKLEDGILKFLNGGSFTAIVTAATEDDGETYTVTDSRIAADGEDSWDDIQDFCEEMGVSSDVYLENPDSAEQSQLEKLVCYANSHPEITGLEFNQEVLTVEQAKEELVDYWMYWAHIYGF